jgi:hypothetical protein
MNDQELSALLQQAREQTPNPTPELAERTLQAWRHRFARPPFFRRHWRLVTAAALLLIGIGIVGTRASTGSPLPPEYDRPGIISSGRMTCDGWRMEYSTVVRPVRSGVLPLGFTGNTVTRPAAGQPIVFHRFLGDMQNKVYFGYDVVLHNEGMSGQLRIRPLSVRPDDLPDQFRAAGSRILEVRELPTGTFACGQNIAVTLLTHPATGQTIVDYVNVDTDWLLFVHHVFGNMLTAVHRHFDAAR